MNSSVASIELRRAVSDAAAWYARLQASEAGDSDRAYWRQWLEASPHHRLAWAEVEQVQANFSRLPGEFTVSALNEARLTRRELIRRLGMVAAVAPVALIAWQVMPWRQWQTGYTTATGERQEVTLADGGLLVLNTDSAADVRYAEAVRQVSLHRGEILVQTAPDPVSPPRPFIVEMPQGRVEALGTRFALRIDRDSARVNVLEKAVRVTAAHGGKPVEIQQGQQLHFTDRRIGDPQPLADNTVSWVNGSLMVVDMPLGDLVAELTRYRPGLLRCDPAVAHLKVSGAFPLDDTDRALMVLERAFPVRQQRVTSYFVRITPA
ncbi:MAG: FecR domain-containing protein [Porticoccaceae bacterium]|nr:FecR domain-containing protein [Porticoccaceae bacterium]